MRNEKGFLPVLIMFVMGTLLVNCGAKAQAQKSHAVRTAPAATQQPLYTEYKGVRLGMTAQEVRAKLGVPTLLAMKENETDYFVFSESEAVQIGYDAALKVKVISIDYQNGTGAPEPRAVVGAELETRENGSLYRIVYYDSLGFWVSYSRTAGPVNIVTITIQKKLSQVAA
jgi:hypothetical protein